MPLTGLAFLFQLACSLKQCPGGFGACGSPWEDLGPKSKAAASLAAGMGLLRILSNANSSWGSVWTPSDRQSAYIA